ncbi:hypothetical protein LTR62_007837 [Meristemomyces frigidus]|uniref:Uncharacterized protein n=1 Tax=Meristemomyces frigidus TaxID=1508187 RepID=A0AAN7TE60_9PEZI|nr:hypothetical protein LTR62_007837 [Meristemomyces frigidus]
MVRNEQAARREQPNPVFEAGAQANTFHARKSYDQHMDRLMEDNALHAEDEDEDEDAEPAIATPPSRKRRSSMQLQSESKKLWRRTVENQWESSVDALGSIEDEISD